MRSAVLDSSIVVIWSGSYHTGTSHQRDPCVKGEFELPLWAGGLRLEERLSQVLCHCNTRG